MSKFDSDGFQTVISKRFSKNKQTKIPSGNQKFVKEEIYVDVEKALSRIHSAVEDLRLSKYLEGVTKSVSTIVQTRKVADIICFGLGHIGECQISKYQLALLLCIKDTFQPVKVLVHDPIFYKSECAILNRLNIEVISENKEGRYIIPEKDFTLVYLPHCPKQLTNNFLWSNWGIQLHHCILICNSFSSLIENQPSRVISETVPFINKIFPYTKEITLDNIFKHTDIYNDTSIHYFPQETLLNLDATFWEKGDKPQYINNEEFITTLMIEKLNI